MSENKIATKADLQRMYNKMLPYLGGMPEMVANKFSKGDLYSTEERMIGQWIDGKPLYQKSFEFTLGSISDSTTAVIVGTIDTSFNIVDIKGIIKWESPNNHMGFVDISSYGSASNFIRAFTHNNDLNIDVSGSHFSNQPGVVTLQYTKTTD